MPRGDQAWRIRALGPRFHAMAEAHLTSWQNWVTTNNKTWVDAGKEFRRRMVVTGYDVSLGDTWAMNEVPSSVRQNAGQSRRNLLDFLKGLYEGDGSAAPTKGLVFVVGLGQRTQNLSVYLGNMRGWLSDSAFWSTADAYVRFWAQEVYGDVRAWGVADAPRMTRSRHLIEYVMHPLNLARAGGEQTAVAEAFLRRTYSRSRTRPGSGARGSASRTSTTSSCGISCRSRCTRSGTTRAPTCGRPERPRGVRVGARERAERAGLPGEDGGPPAAARIGVRERLRPGRPRWGLRAARRPRLVRGRRRRSRVQRGVERLLDLGVSTVRAWLRPRPCSLRRGGRRPGRRGEAEAERADREGADRDALAPHRHLLPATDRLALLVGQLLPRRCLRRAPPACRPR